MVTENIPKNPMKSTWRSWDRSKWSHPHWMIELLSMHPKDLDKDTPVFQKTDKMAYVPHLQCHKFILVHSCFPLLIHFLYTYLTGRSLHPIAAVALYIASFKYNSIRQMNMLRVLGHKHGFLDGDKHARDEIPDADVGSVFHSLFITSFARPVMCVLLAYRRDQPPTLSWWLPVEIGLYSIILDFWFYWYHRSMHDFDSFWKFHRKHHMTKHPNPLLSLYADHEQELFDIAVVPFLAWGTLRLMGLPMGFPDWWVCHQYILFAEIWGHSGLRVLTTPPTTATPLLKLFNAELTTEDHDLHHRQGWKKSHNYGKQTRLWDRIFGTCADRIEAVPENIDWNHQVSLYWL